MHRASAPQRHQQGGHALALGVFVGFLAVMATFALHSLLSAVHPDDLQPHGRSAMQLATHNSKDAFEVAVVDESSGGQLYYASRDMDTITAALLRRCARPMIAFVGADPAKLLQLPGQQTRPDLLLCFAMVDIAGTCRLDTMPADTQLAPVINMIPEYRNIIWRKDALCRQTEHILALSPRAPLVPCHVVSHDELDESVYAFMINSQHLSQAAPLQLAASYQRLGKTIAPAFIVKPVAAGEGKGIFSVSSGEELQHLLLVQAKSAAQDTAKGSASDGADARMIISPLLSAPLLVFGRKADLRCYVLVTSAMPAVASIYNDCVVRLAVAPYRHGARRGGKKAEWLTNTHYSSFKKSKSASPPHLSSLSSASSSDSMPQALTLREYIFTVLATEEVAGIVENLSGKEGRKGDADEETRELEWRKSLHDHILGQLASISRLVLLAAEREIALAIKSKKSHHQQHQHHQRQYQLLGVDLFVDEQWNCRLIEVNGLPSLSTSAVDSTAYKKLKINLYDAVLRELGVCAKDTEILGSNGDGVGNGEKGFLTSAGLSSILPACKNDLNSLERTLISLIPHLPSGGPKTSRDAGMLHSCP